MKIDGCCMFRLSINWSERIVIFNKVDHINSEGGESGDTTEIVYCTCNIKYKLS